MFVRMMREYETFLEVRVLSYVIMDNHFHLLVEVPPKKKGAAVDMNDEVFLAKIQAFYPKAHYVDVTQMLERFRKAKSDGAAEELKASYTRRMHDLSIFMQCLKMRFTQWFNKTHKRTGTLWEGRFKSILVQDGYATRVMAAYIDLNPIRAGMVGRPEDYAWSSYGEAMKPVDDAGRVLARAAICRVLQKNRGTGGRVREENSVMVWDNGVGSALGDVSNSGVDTGSESAVKLGSATSMSIGAADQYQMMLFADGEEVFVDNPATGEVHKKVRKGFKRKDVGKVLAHGGKLTFGESLRCRIRYLSDGMTFGSRDFVDEVFQKSRSRFGPKRKSGARPMCGIGWKQKESRLYTMRQLRKDVVG